MDDLETFLDFTYRVLRHASERQRAHDLLHRWVGAWQGQTRSLSSSFSNHGAYLHFHQSFGNTWSTVLTFHAAHQHGLSMRGPDPDRARKSHKLRRHKLDRGPLDEVFTAWSAHPEHRPAGLAVEFYLEETPDDTWEACLREALQHLGA